MARVRAKENQQQRGPKSKFTADMDDEGYQAENQLDDEDFLTHRDKLLKYLTKIDPSQHQSIEAFGYILLYAALQGGVELEVSGNKKHYKMFSTVRKLMKDVTYKQGRLTPRVSDPDFYSPDGKPVGLQPDALADAMPAQLEYHHLSMMMQEGAEEAKKVWEFAAVSKVGQVPVYCIPEAANAVNNTMLKLFSIAEHGLGLHPNLQSAANSMFGEAWAQVEYLMPWKWDATLDIVDTVVKQNFKALLEGDVSTEAKPFKNLLSLGVGRAHMDGCRLELWIHIVKTLGSQRCRVPEGVVVGQHSFMPPLIRDVLGQLGDELLQSKSPVQVGCLQVAPACKLLQLARGSTWVSLGQFMETLGKKLWPYY